MRFCSHSNNSQSVLSGLKTRGEALKLQYPRNIAPLRNRTGEERRRQILCDKRYNNSGAPRAREARARGRSPIAK